MWIMLAFTFLITLKKSISDYMTSVCNPIAKETRLWISNTKINCSLSAIEYGNCNWILSMWAWVCITMKRIVSWIGQILSDARKVKSVLMEKDFPLKKWLCDASCRISQIFEYFYISLLYPNLFADRSNFHTMSHLAYLKALLRNACV